MPMTHQIVAFSPPEPFEHSGQVRFQMSQQPMMLGKQEGPQSFVYQTIH